MTLQLLGHHFSSYTQKVKTALYENDLAFDFREIGPDHPDVVAEWLRRWPLARFPVLVDGERQVVETSVIIEYLQLVHPGPVQLIPSDPMAALDVRLMDRFFDLHVMNAANEAVAGALTGDAALRAHGLATAGKKLDLAYPWLDEHMRGKQWACGDAFTMADCSAAMALFYADWVHRIPPQFERVHAYRARLLARPSFARCVDEARYFRKYFPLGAPDRD